VDGRTKSEKRRDGKKKPLEVKQSDKGGGESSKHSTSLRWVKKVPAATILGRRFQRAWGKKKQKSHEISGYRKKRSNWLKQERGLKKLKHFKFDRRTRKKKA